MANYTPLNIFDRIVSLGETIVKKTKLGSIVDGPLALAILALLAGFIASFFNGDRIYLYLGCIPTIFFFLFYGYFAITNPLALRSEKHEEFVIRVAAGLGEKGKELPEDKIEELPSETDTLAIEAEIAENEEL